MGAGIARRRIELRTAILMLWRVLAALLVILVLLPVRYGSLRLALLVLPALLWAGAFYLFGRKRGVRIALLVLPMVLVLPLLLPSRPTDAARLRKEYVRSLASYDGINYVWGGETRRGIDCSGLIRCGMIDADLRIGLRSADGGALREALDLWWHDSSARALGEEYRGKTRLLFEAESLNEIDYRRLLPGDIAVTASGVHTLAYIGDNTWIQADPGSMRVTRTRVPSDNGWFGMPVRILRWRQLDG